MEGAGGGSRRTGCAIQSRRAARARAVSAFFIACFSLCLLPGSALAGEAAPNGELPPLPVAATPEEEFDFIRKLADAGEHQPAARALRDFIRANARWARIDEANLLYGIMLVESGDVTVGCEVLERIIQAAPQDEKNAPAFYFRGNHLQTIPTLWQRTKNPHAEP